MVEMSESLSSVFTCAYRLTLTLSKSNFGDASRATSVDNLKEGANVHELGYFGIELGYELFIVPFDSGI